MDYRGIVIKQKELEEIMDHQHEIAWRSKRRDEMLANLKPLLEAGVPIEPGRFEAMLSKRIGCPGRNYSLNSWEMKSPIFSRSVFARMCTSK